MHLLTEAGFSMFNSDPNLLFSPSISPPQSPVSPDHFVLASQVPDHSEGGARSHNGAADSPCITTMLAEGTQHKGAADHEVRSKGERTRSPLSGEVRVLPSDLVCVGLDDSIDHWGLKVIKLLAYPELIGPRSLDNEETIEISDPAVFASRARASASDSSSISSDDSEDAYFSHSPQTNASTTTFFTSESSPDLTKPSNAAPSRHLINVIFPLSPIVQTPIPRRPKSPLSISTKAVKSRSYRVPFFSFTRTQEGSSLTTNVRLLAALFPSNERHMLMCSGELERADGDDYDQADDEEDQNAKRDMTSDSLSGTSLKCLQIDLARFGLGWFVPFSDARRKF